MAFTRRTTHVAPATAETIAAAAACLRAGGLVAMPTETVYGLAADATSDAAVAGVYAAKGRPTFNPLIAHVLDVAAARREGAVLPRGGRACGGLLAGAAHARRAGRAELSRQSFGPRGSRHPCDPRPAHETARALIEAARDAARRPFGQPLGPRQSDDRRACSGRSRGQDRLDSRRRALAPRPRIDDRRVSRCGADTAAAGRDCARGDRGRPSGVACRSGPRGNAPNAPGQLESHYAPRARLRLEAADVESDEAALDFAGALAAGAAAVARLDLSPSGDLVEAASNLFAYLRALDETGAPRIAAAPVPHRGLGAAINDRLKRAAAPREA